MKYIVEYYIKHKPGIHYQEFETIAEARAFMTALYFNSECDCYSLKYKKLQP